MNSQYPSTRIVFMGTPEFAVPSLRALCESRDRYGWQIVSVATQPDRPAGRGKKIIASPVKQYASKCNLDVWQPDRLRKRPQAIDHLRALAPDLIVVAAYRLILPKSVLEIPTYGSINVHASLLPAYRGASPITAAILHGLSETGVSIMLMAEGMDTGPVLAQSRLPIRKEDTTGTLSARLAKLGASSLVETLPRWLSGDLAPIPQDELPGEVSLCHLIKKEQGRIDWQDSAVQIERLVRAYAPWPSAHTLWRGQPFKIWETEAVAGEAEPGLVIDTISGPAVGTGAGLLLLRTVQPAGKRAMDIRSFLNGAPNFLGSHLGA